MVPARIWRPRIGDVRNSSRVSHTGACRAEVSGVQAEERQHQILVSARADGSVDVGKLAAELGVAPETIRRDLRVLERHGLVQRTHGGAYPVETSQFETSLAARTTRRVPEKRRIAAAAGGVLGDAGTRLHDQRRPPP